MANITLSVDEAVLASARRYAVDHDTTVNGLVREFLTSLARSARIDARKARRRIRQLADRSASESVAQLWTARTA